MKIFLTGATGYIGGSVAERLLREGHAITGLVRTQQGAHEIGKRGCVLSSVRSTTRKSLRAGHARLMLLSTPRKRIIRA